MEDLNRDIILLKLKKNEPVLRKLGVNKIGLFGSYLHGLDQADSDIDILVGFEQGKTNYDNFINLCFFLDELFKGKKVDVVTTNSLSPYIGPKILENVDYVSLST